MKKTHQKSYKVSIKRKQSVLEVAYFWVRANCIDEAYSKADLFVKDDQKMAELKFRQVGEEVMPEHSYEVTRTIDRPTISQFYDGVLVPMKEDDARWMQRLLEKYLLEVDKSPSGTAQTLLTRVKRIIGTLKGELTDPKIVKRNKK